MLSNFVSQISELERAKKVAFDNSEKIRQNLKADVVDLREQVEKLEKEHDGLTKQIKNVEAKITEYKASIKKSEILIAAEKANQISSRKDFDEKIQKLTAQKELDARNSINSKISMLVPPISAQVASDALYIDQVRKASSQQRSQVAIKEPRSQYIQKPVIDLTADDSSESDEDETVDQEAEEKSATAAPATAPVIEKSVEQKSKGHFGIVYDARMSDHNSEDPKQKILEVPNRIKWVYDKLVAEKFFDRPLVKRVASRKVTNDELLLCHIQDYIDNVRDNIENGMAFERVDEDGKTVDDDDMFFNKKSLESIYLAAGCAAELADAYLEGKITCGMAIVRPPGHHAKHNKQGGFCFFNNAAICAAKLTVEGYKVLIVDYDIHLGDGTIDIMETTQKDNDLLRYYSIHRHNKGNFFPFGDRGASTDPNKDERISLVAIDSNSCGNMKFIGEFKKRFDSATHPWKPDIIVVSAGFDAAEHDIGGCKFDANGYAEITRIMYDFCPNVLMVLEGGYNRQQVIDCSYAAINKLEKLLQQ